MNKIIAYVVVITLVTFGSASIGASGQAHAASGGGNIVSSAPSGTSLRPSGQITAQMGTTIRLCPSGDRAPYRWESSNSRIAAVTQQGVLRIRRAGLAIVTASDPHSGNAATYIVKTFRKRTQRQAYRALITLRRSYREGARWTNDDRYFWQAKLLHCGGCAAFAGIASDTAFGKFAPLHRHASYARIKVGDHIRVAGKHSVIALKMSAHAITVAEGNYHGKIKWGRRITRAELVKRGFYVETRY